MGSSTLTAIERLELELLVRDVLEALSLGLPDGCVGLLHPHVIVRTRWTGEVRGREPADRECRLHLCPIQGSPILVSQITVSDSGVLAEYRVALPRGDGRPTPVTVRSLYTVEDFMIRGWQQLEG